MLKLEETKKPLIWHVYFIFLFCNWHFENIRFHSCILKWWNDDEQIMGMMRESLTGLESSMIQFARLSWSYLLLRQLSWNSNTQSGSPGRILWNQKRRNEAMCGQRWYILHILNFEFCNFLPGKVSLINSEKVFIINSLCKLFLLLHWIRKTTNKSARNENKNSC